MHNEFALKFLELLALVEDVGLENEDNMRREVKMVMTALVVDGLEENKYDDVESYLFLSVRGIKEADALRRKK